MPGREIRDEQTPAPAAPLKGRAWNPDVFAIAQNNGEYDPPFLRRTLARRVDEIEFSATPVGAKFPRSTSFHEAGTRNFKMQFSKSLKDRLAAAALLALLSFSDRILASDVIIDARMVLQRIDGFGSSVRVFDDPHVFENFNAATNRAATTLTTAQQNAVLDKLYVDLKLTRVRPASPETQMGVGIEPQNDNGDPNVIDASKFNFTWKNLDAHADYISRARQRGVSTYFLSPLNREAWMGTGSMNDAAEYAEWLLAQALRCQELGVPLPYISVANEPSYGNILPATFIRDVIKILGPRLRAANLDTLFVLPDDVRSTDAAAVAAVVLEDAGARSYVGALATHLYDEPISNLWKMKALADRYGMPLWMTEYSSALANSAGLGNAPIAWANLMHELLSVYNVSAIDYQWGFFGQWESDSQLIVLNHRETAEQSYTGFTLTKEYHFTGQYSRFVRQGARRVRAESSLPHVKITAYVDWPRVTIVALNIDTNAWAPSFSVLGLPPIDVLLGVRTSATEDWATIEPLVVSDSTFTATLPPQSVTTFTATLPELRLDVVLSEDNVVLSWPVGAAGYVLQATDRLSPALAWTTVMSPVAVVGEKKVVTLPVDSDKQFYRLHRP